MHEPSPRSRHLWWSLGIAVASLAVATLLAIGWANLQQRRLIAEIEDLGGLVRTEPVAPDWMRDPAVDVAMRGTDPVVRAKVARRSMTTEQFAALVARLDKLPELRSLRAAYTKVGDAELKQLRRLRSLEAIDLDSTAVTDAGVAELEALPNLTWLVLDNTAVTDQAVAQLVKLQRLEMVSVENTTMGDEGLRQLAELPNLDRIYLKGTRVTDEGVREFQQRRPDVRVNR